MKQNLNTVQDKSGSCATVMLITKQMIYVVNTGDSRAFMSSNGGQQVDNITRDHKPSEESERIRIERGGGSVY
jgi:protein phosphatase 2C family protein 2/3